MEGEGRREEAEPKVNLDIPKQDSISHLVLGFVIIQTSNCILLSPSRSKNT
jgi:hypothetical protein